MEHSDKIKKGAEDFANRFEGVMKDLAEGEHSTEDTVETLVDEFAKKITSCTHVGGFHTCVLDDPKDNESYKQKAIDYFRNALTSERTRCRESFFRKYERFIEHGIGCITQFEEDEECDCGLLEALNTEVK